MIRIVVRLAALAIGTVASVATLAPPASRAQAPAGAAVVALTNARLIDGTGRAPIERGTVIIAGGRISGVGASGSVVIPPGAQRIDATGKTIVPGFISAHAHVVVQEGATLPVRDDLLRRLKTYALYGITSAVSLGSTPADEREGLTLMYEQERIGLDRARVYTAGINTVGKTPDEARRDVNRLADLKVHAIKFHIDGNPRDMNEPTWSAIIEQAHVRGLKAAVHIFYAKDAQAAVERGVDVIAHSIRDQDASPALISAIKQKNVAYIPTLTRDLSTFVYETTPPFFEEAFFKRGMALYQEEVELVGSAEWQANLRKDPTAARMKQAIVQAKRNVDILNRAGVTIAMGTDSGSSGDPGRWQGYFEHVEMEMMSQAGMTPMQVIVSATGTAAKTFGLTSVGTLQVGKWADLVVLSANPLDDIRNTRSIDSIWIAGARLAGVPPAAQTR